MPACDRGAVRRDLTGRDTISNVERVLQHRLDVARPSRPRMRLGNLAASPDQMRETCLVRCMIELAIRRPAVADEDAVELGAEHRRGFGKSAPILNGVHDGARGRKDPQPPEPPTHFPTGFIRTDDRTAANLFAQRRIGGGRATRGAMQGVRHAAGPHAQPEPVAQQRRDLAVRQAQLFVEQHDQCDRVGPQMRAGGAESVGGLQRMPPLHVPPAVGATADVDVEAAHMRPHDRQILLNLWGDAGLGQPAATVRAGRWQRHINRFVNRRGRVSMRVAAVPLAPSPTGSTRRCGRRAFRERRRLTLPCAARRLQRLCQPLNLAPQAIALAFEALVLVAQAFTVLSRLLNLAAQPLQLSLGVVNRLRCVASRHATFMADSPKKYKSNIWIRPPNPLTNYKNASLDGQR
jgi:hypothetical protein